MESICQDAVAAEVRRRNSIYYKNPPPHVGGYVFLILMTAMIAQSAAPIMADVVLLDGNVRTMDNDHPIAEAIAVLGNRIVAVGTTEEIRLCIGTRTRTIDAGGRLVLPGFNDAHVHFLSGGFQLSGVDLRDANSREEFSERIRRFAKTVAPGRWITGGDWDHERWPGAPLPTKEWIDAATTNTPVFVSRLDGHMALANSLALRLAGITAQSEPPAGGLIVRDPKTGEPTGLLKDAAMSLIYKVIPA